jgi:cell division protein FtsB
MPIELTQTLVNALLLLVVAFVGGSLGLRRFEAIERSIVDLRGELTGDISDLRTELKTEISDLRTELKGDIAELRAELKGDIAGIRVELKGETAELRTELKADIADLRSDLGGMRSEHAQMRSDLTQIALAVGARSVGTPERRGSSGSGS